MLAEGVTPVPGRPESSPARVRFSSVEYSGRTTHSESCSQAGHQRSSRKGVAEISRFEPVPRPQEPVNPSIVPPVYYPLKKLVRSNPRAKFGVIRWHLLTRADLGRRVDVGVVLMGWKLGGSGLHDVAAVQAYCDGSFVPATGAGGWDVRVVECLPRGLG